MPPTSRRIRIEDVFGVPWAIREDVLSQIAKQTILVAKNGLTLVSAATRHVDTAELLALEGPHEGAARAGAVSIVPIYDVIENHSDWITEMFGGTTVDGLRATLTAEINDPNVKAIVLEIDSPGGTVAGITELCAEIRAVRGGSKPIIAVANTCAASAAYWIGSQADEFVVTPSGSVGSVGVYATHQDISGMLEQMGIDVTLISFGPYKTEGNEFEPLSDAATAAIQGRVDAAGETFVADVAAGRRVSTAEVLANYGGGRLLIAKDALVAGMVDRVATLAQTVDRLNRASGSVPRGTRAAGLLLELEAAAIGRHTTDTTDDAWDGNAAEANLPSGDGAEPALRKAHAWVDDEADPNLKTSYKFIHHDVDADGTVGAANMTACSTGIGYLNRDPGSPGRPDIPDADRAGVHRHLAGHMTDAGMTPAPMVGTPPFTERVAALALEATAIVDHAQERARLRAKEGRPAFSTTTERSLRAIREAVDDLLEPGDPAPSEPPEPAVEPPPVATVMPPLAASTPRRMNRDDFLRHLEAMNQ